MPHPPFHETVIEAAWIRAGGRCQCCGKLLSRFRRGRNSGKGAWEAHLGRGRVTPMILCTAEPENCHLYCGHGGSYLNPGVSPRVHRGGGYVRW